MTWWLFQSSRLLSEKAALADLEGSVDWLQIGKWQTNAELAMCVDFRVTHGGEEFAFRMIYPGVFPDAPPMVYTEVRSRISNHQYGSDGELCLEYRPDNWHPSIKGADMVASCHRLLSEERPDANTAVHARSAHVASLGRDLRSKFCRFLLTEADLQALNDVKECTPIKLVLTERFVAHSLISSINHFGDKDSPAWTSDLILPKSGRDEAGYVVRLPGAGVKGNIAAADLKALFEGGGLHDFSEMLLDDGGSTHLLLGGTTDWRLFWIHGKSGEREVMSYTTVRVPLDAHRVPEEFQALADKKVGIVGCGSVGSKIAASLCRSGVGKFLLIDEDIFFPGNVARNDLSLQQTGAHKSYALRDRLLELDPKCDAKALRLSLGGQESAESMAGALEALGACDLLIDATAEPIAFNMITSVATRRKKPMVWAEVFAGGIGGFVARARPQLDPVPILACAQLDSWCTDQGVEWVRPKNAGRYGGEGEDGQPFIADDAEVTLIASHACRFATDILARPNASIFPVSAYVVGLSSEWLFEEPFDTRPIDLRPDGVWGETIDPLEPEERVKLLEEHIPPKKEADATPAAD